MKVQSNLSPMDEQQGIWKQKNSNRSILLIVLNLILLLVFINIGYASENQQLLNIVYGVVGLTILLAGYAFSYHGKGYRLGKWLFGIALLISLILISLLWYVTELGKAFAH